MRYWIDIENSSGTRQGAGPIATVQSWQHSARLDQAGAISFALAATDPRAALLVAKRAARCRGKRGGVIADLGAGIIDQVSLGAATSVGPTLAVAGNDILDELATRTVGFLLLSDGAGGPTTNALAPILALAPAGWTLDTGAWYGTTATGVYIEFAGESVLTALCKVAELTGEHFRLGTGRQVQWLRTDQPAATVRAVQAGSGVALEANTGVAVITDLTEERDSHDLYTRIYPYGAGNGTARLTLADTTRSAPAGYTLSIGSNYVEYAAGASAYGQIERHAVFKDLVATGTTGTDPVSAANALFDAALAELKRHQAIIYAYRLGLAQCEAVVRPGEWLRVVFRKTVDGVVVLNLNQDLLVLEATLQIDSSGIRTVGLLVATVARWPASDAEHLVRGVRQAQAMEAHHQPAQSALAAVTVTDTTIPHTNSIQTWTAAQDFAAGTTLDGVPIAVRPAPANEVANFNVLASDPSGRTHYCDTSGTVFINQQGQLPPAASVPADWEVGFVLTMLGFGSQDILADGGDVGIITLGGPVGTYNLATVGNTLTLRSDGVARWYIRAAY